MAPSNVFYDVETGRALEDSRGASISQQIQKYVSDFRDAGDCLRSTRPLAVSVGNLNAKYMRGKYKGPSENMTGTVRQYFAQRDLLERDS